MTNAVLQIAMTLAILILLAIPLGGYIKKIMDGKRTPLSPVMGPVENGIYRILRIDPKEEMTWKQYALAVFAFSAVGFVVLFALQLLQGVLPGNPYHAKGLSWDLAFNTAASFVANTNWQSYAGESTMSWLTQAIGLTVQNFVSAAAGIAVLFALIRGFTRVKSEGVGSFWVDMTRIILHLLLPLSLVIAILLSAGGVVQNVNPSRTVDLLEPIAVGKEGKVLEHATIDPKTHAVTVDGKPVAGATVITKQYLPGGTAASQVAIKQLGTNGGGYFGANSAHPFENPSPFTNLVESVSILLIPMALCFTFGQAVRNKKQGIALFLAMFLLLAFALFAITASEYAATPQLAQHGAVNLSQVGQIGGNMEGKETRFGIAGSSLWAAFTTAASNGSVNASLDSFTPLGGMIPMLLIQLGEVIFGGVGSGLYGMLSFAILTVFIAGLMVGRTPEFLGKKIEPREMKWAVLVCLATPMAILIGSGVAAAVPGIEAHLSNGGAHGFSELLYAFSSAGGNNGSAFAGLDANAPFLNVALGLCILFGRFLPIYGTLAIAGSIARKKKVAEGPGTLATDNAMFVFLLILVVLLIGALSFFPALALGPIAEHFQSLS